MNRTETSASSEPVHQGRFNYLSASVGHSLFRNGKVLTRRDKDGSDAGTQGVDLEPIDVGVQNARLREDSSSCTLKANGFQLLDRSLECPDLDFLVHEQVTKTYYPECADIVRDASGATFVAAFDHNVRSAIGKNSKKRIEGGQQVQGPAHVVHGDYTLTSAPQRLRDLTNPPGANDTLRSLLGDGQSLLDKHQIERVLNGGHFAIINVWRNIMPEPVATQPLALCDGQSVEPDDLVVFEIHYHDRIGENYFAKYSKTHQWYFYPAITRDESLLIKQWDSRGALAYSGGETADNSAPDNDCTFSFHSAFEDPATPDGAPDRWSIEVRCVALFD